jgi:membrane protease YdiL (CAAX protease family)
MILLPIAFSIVVLVIYIERLIRHTRGEKDMGRLKLSNPNEILMLIFGLGVVLAWVIIAATASYYSIVEVRDITDSQLTVIGLLGGPALLIITSVLDLFKGKEGAKINILPDQLASDVTAAEAVDTHTRMLEEYKLKHDLEMEKMQKQHSLDMEAYQITNGKTKEAKK